MVSSRRRVLFICTQNIHRSRTAAELYSRNDELEVKSAGLDRGANTPLTQALLEWSDVAFVMERRHRNEIRKRWPDLYAVKRIVCLYVPDEFESMAPELLGLLESRLIQYLGPARGSERRPGTRG